MGQQTDGKSVETSVYQCGICGKEFDSEEALEKHIKRVGIVE
jgi:DNA-directed RNA polymerase subunit RPC12/RpoP